MCVAMSLWLDVRTCVHTQIACHISFYATGVSYFVYGEMVDVYGGDPKLKEFMDVGLKFIQSLIRIGTSLPIYRLHIYTKPYREYVDTLNKLQDCGMLQYGYACMRDYLANDIHESCEHAGHACMPSALVSTYTNMTYFTLALWYAWIRWNVQGQQVAS